MSSDMILDDSPLIQQPQLPILQQSQPVQDSDNEMAIPAVVSQDDDDGDGNDNHNDNHNDNEEEETPLFTINNSPPSSPSHPILMGSDTTSTSTSTSTVTSTTTRRSPRRRRRNSVAPKAMRMAAASTKQNKRLGSVRLVVKVDGQVVDQGEFHSLPAAAAAAPHENCNIDDSHSNNNKQTIASTTGSASVGASAGTTLRSVRLVVKVEGQVVDQGEFHSLSAAAAPHLNTMDDSHGNNKNNSDVSDSQSPRKRSWESSSSANINLPPLVRSRTPLRADGTPLRKAKKTLSSTQDNDLASLTRALPLASTADKAQISMLETHTQWLFPCLSIAANAAHSCVVAPILAAFELFGPDAPSPTIYETPSKRTRGTANRVMLKRTTSGSEPSPLLSLFEALVQLELVLLSSGSGSSTKFRRVNGVNRASKQSTTRVHFAAFDGSALQPPSDVLEGSHQHQEATIEGLTNVLRVIDQLSNSDTNQLQAATNKLSQLIDYLDGDSFETEHAQLCADLLSLHSGNIKSIGPIFYPVKRVLRAASSYLDDFRVLLSNWQTRLNCQADQELSLTVTVPSMSWHIRLSDAISQLVRYWLRTQLNPVPDRAPAHCSSQEWMQRVSDIVSLAIEENTGSSLIANAIDDGSLSSLVSNATSHIFEFFGPNLELWKEKMESTPPSFLEGSRLAVAGIAPSKGERSTNKRRRSGPSLTEYSDEEWDGVEGELEVATSFLAAVQGAAFLQELLSVIVKHPDSVYCNAWQDTIQAAAKHLEETPARVALHSQDSHLVLLQHSPSVLLSNLPGIIDMDKRDACQSALGQFAKRFLMKTAGLRMDAKMTRRKRSYQPYVGNLEYTYELAISKTAFPSVVSLEE